MVLVLSQTGGRETAAPRQSKSLKSLPPECVLLVSPGSSSQLLQFSEPSRHSFIHSFIKVPPQLFILSSVFSFSCLTDLLLGRSGIPESRGVHGPPSFSNLSRTKSPDYHSSTTVFDSLEEMLVLISEGLGLLG